MNFVKDHSPFTTNTKKQDQSNSTFYDYNEEVVENLNPNIQQNNILNESKSEIDMIRSSALASMHSSSRQTMVSLFQIEVNISIMANLISF